MTFEFPLPADSSAEADRTAPPPRTKVLVVDDHEVVRAGLISLIDREGDLSICGDAATEVATLERVRFTRPDVAVVDWSLGDRDASSLMTKLRVECPEMPMLVLSMHDEAYYAERAVRAGASGYVMKHEASGKLIAAIRAVAAGHRFFSERAECALSGGSCPPPPMRNTPLLREPHGDRRVASSSIPPWAPSLVIAAILFAIGFVLYEVTLPFPFAFDDYPYLLNNPLWQDARSFLFPREFSEFANRAARLRLESDLSTNFILRPVAYLTFHLNLLIGGLAPAGYRAVNVLIHCANAALVFALAARLFRLAAGTAPTRGSLRFIPWTAALIFLVHPLQTESVTYIIQRFTSLGTTFFLGSVLLFVMARTEDDATRAQRYRHASLVTLLLGMLTKEFLFVAPLAMLLIERVIVGTPFRAAVKYARPWLLCLPLIPVLLILTAAAQHPGGLSFEALLNVASPMPGGPHANSQAAYQHRYALTQPNVILTYLRLLLLPRGLNLDPDYPVTTSAWEWRFIGPFSTILLLAGSAWWWAARHRTDPRGTLAAFGLLWFFLTLSIDSSVVPLPDLMAEHRTYLPSVGFVIAIAALADLARTRGGPHSRMQWIVPSGMAAVAIALAAATVARNEVWRSPVTLWTDTVAKSPNKVRPWMNLGTAYHQSERWSPSLECYQRALALGPPSAQLWAAVAVAENAVGAYDRALAAAKDGLLLNPTVENLHLATAFAYERLGQRHAAVASLHEWLRRIPESRRARLGLAGVSLELGDLAETARQLEDLRALGPLDPEQQHAFDRVATALAQRARLHGSRP